MNSLIPFIATGCCFCLITFSTDFTAVGALGFCLLYSSIERATGVPVTEGAEAEAGAGAGAALEIALIAATVGEGAND